MVERTQGLYGEEESALKGTLLHLFSTDSHPARKLAFEMTTAPTAESDEQEESDEDVEDDEDEYLDDLD